MNTILIWILVSVGSTGTARPATVIHKFADQTSCIDTLKSLEQAPGKYMCVPAKTIPGKEHT